MKPWTKMTNDELSMHLYFWLELDGKVSTKSQKEFFEEVAFRLNLMDYRIKEGKNE